MSPNSRKHLDSIFADLFARDNLDARIMTAYVQKVLYQYGLGKAYEAKDILIEVYSRAVRLVDTGETIRIPTAWIKRTATNVIREFRREAERIDYYNIDHEPAWNDDFLLNITFRYDLKAMKQAFARLNSDEQYLLQLRVIDRLPWREVSRCFVTAGEVECHEVALRQRGLRTLKKLRKLYEEERKNIRFKFDEPDLT